MKKYAIITIVVVKYNTIKIQLKYNTEDCIEKLCKKLKKRAMKITNYEKKK